MFTVKFLPECLQWLKSLPDAKVRAVIAARVKRLEHGLMGDVKPVGAGVSELRIHLGAGWRVYFTRHGEQVVVLLTGGTKRTQQQDIARAQTLAANLPPVSKNTQPEESQSKEAQSCTKATNPTPAPSRPAPKP